MNEEFSLYEGWEWIEPRRKTSIVKVIETIEGDPIEPSLVMQMPSEKLLSDIVDFFDKITEKLPADYVVNVKISIENDWALNAPLGKTFRGKQLDMDPEEITG